MSGSHYDYISASPRAFYAVREDASRQATFAVARLDGYHAEEAGPGDSLIAVTLYVSGGLYRLTVPNDTDSWQALADLDALLSKEEERQ